MAAVQNRALVVVNDFHEGYLLFDFDLNHLFAGEPDQEFPPILSLPEPVARFDHCLCRKPFTIAISGNLLVAVRRDYVSNISRTLLYDTDSRSVSAGPDMLYRRTSIILVPVAGMFLAMSRCPHIDPKGATHFELLLRLPDSDRWAWHPIPDPPLLSTPGRHGREWAISGYFVAGAHVWVSFIGEGTFSFDTARRLWLSEGTWELPVMGKAHMFSDFLGTGRQLLFGISSEEFGCHLCTVDMEARPPAITKSWPEARVCRLAWRAGYCALLNTVSLAYHGGGRFCISMFIQTGHWDYNETTGTSLPRNVISLTAVEVTPGLQLLRRKSNCYLMPRGSPVAYML